MRTDPETDPVEITCWAGIGVGFCLLAYWVIKGLLSLMVMS